EIRQEDFDFAEYTRFLAENAESIEEFRTRQQAAFTAEVARWQAEDAASPPSSVVMVDEPEDDVVDGHPVAADLCGNLWKILVELGQRVEVGQDLVVVEAMKMELTVSAPISGTVKAIRCQPGKAVGPGDTLLFIEPLTAEVEERAS